MVHVINPLLRHCVGSIFCESIVKLPVGATEMKRKRHVREEIVGRERATEMLMWALWC